MCSASHEKDDWIDGEKTEDVVSYLDRLYTAKKKVEQRIVVLGGEDDSVRVHELFISLVSHASSRKISSRNLPRRTESAYGTFLQLQLLCRTSWSSWTDAAALF